MNRTHWMRLSFLFALALALTASSGWAGQQGQERAMKANVKLPAAVAQAVKTNCPGAEIDKLEIENEAGINLYDIEFKADQGEIEVAEEGTVMDIATIITMKELPEAAAEAIQKAAAGATIKQIEKSEVRAEIKKEGETGKIVKLATPRYVYEAEFVKGDQRGEVEVAPDGQVVEGPKWNADKGEKKEEIAENEENEEEEEGDEEKEEQEEAKLAAPDLKILPPAVLTAFKTAYPNAVIKGASKETEKGVTYYEIESVDGKMNRDLLYTADGRAVEIEEAIPPESLPAAVQQALAREYPGYKVLKAEGMTKDGQKLFELQILVNDKKKGVTIDPSGKIIE